MSLYISDDYGLGTFELKLALLANVVVKHHLDNLKEQSVRLSDRRRRTSAKFNEARWGLPDRKHS